MNTESASSARADTGDELCACRNILQSCRTSIQHMEIVEFSGFARYLEAVKNYAQPPQRLKGA